MNNQFYKKLLLQEKEIKRNGMHSFHRYFGKLIPAIPGFAIRNFTKEGDYVLDSFCGSGTTLLEAKVLNRNAYGVDLNPLAVFVAKIKTKKNNKEKIQNVYDGLKQAIGKDKKDYSKADEPYCVNIDHWFKDFAKRDLIKLRRHILELPAGDVKNFFLGCFSAFLRGVSNADPQHVFPGYSKRMRALDAKGERKINVMEAFDRAVRKRIQYLDSIPSNDAAVKVYVGDSRSLPSEIEKVNLVVVNPPYISSIRYLETMKIEMGWLGFINDQKEYLGLDKRAIGTERFYKRDLDSIDRTDLPKLDRQINHLLDRGQDKMAKVVSQYFIDMKKSIAEMHRTLKKGGHLVFKISDSEVRGEMIPTREYFTDISNDLGMKTVACFQDKINENSRSLLTARNTYSGIITHDWILIFEK